FGTLLYSATLHIGDNQMLGDPEQFYRYLEENRIHIFNFIPIILNDLLGNRKKPESLRVLITGGDKLEENVKNRLLENGYDLYNHYGPTEATVEALTGQCTRERVNLGTPIANTACYILDKVGNPVPVGVKGELTIAGVGVGRGYLNRPELTREKFVPNPFDSSTRMYKSGDHARWLPNGTIDFIGRIDHQVKIRGYRVELGEIEARLLEKEEIKETVVVAKEDENGEKYLCAYIVTEKPQQTTEAVENPTAIEAAELREYLYKTLPDYMVPSYYVTLETVPLTPNGKVDHAALPEPGTGTTDSEYSEPRDELEKKLVEMWAEVLKIDKQKAETTLGIDDDFFNLGGHSLKATFLAAGIQKEFEVKLPLPQLF
ncbi:MAG: non-ribosomal peptide synthetase, partial [bacterium]|nr:non-ribosomal peptide synthetase [bacterium]